MSFLDSLEPASRELLLSVARPVSYVPTAVLVRHGEPARGAYILQSGTVEAMVTLPGGESVTLPPPTTFTVSVNPENVTVKLLALVAVPEEVVTRIGPVVAPAGTVSRTWVAESTVKLLQLANRIGLEDIEYPKQQEAGNYSQHRNMRH